MTNLRLHFTRTILSLVVMAGTFGWWGCGDDNGSSPPPASTPTTAPPPSPTPAAGAGLIGELTGAAIASDGTISATFVLTDGSGQPLIPTLSAAQNSQQARVRLTIARLEEYSGGGGDLVNRFLRYVNEVNVTRPAYDSGGTIETVDAAAGIFRYTFRTKLPNADRALTHSVGMQVDRTFAGQQLSANPVLSFVPSGGTPRQWEDVTTAQCNACHAPLIVHGNRREVALCKLCHTEAAVDEKGTSIDLRNMIHKIHAGKDLPSVVDGPPGSKYAIFSSFARQDVVFAEKLADGEVVGVGFPRALEECLTCHTEGPTAEYYRTKPATASCATCHDDVNPSTQTTAAGPPGTNHRPGGFADGQCNGCHMAEMNQEFDISVPGAHIVPERSTQLAGLNVEITGLTNHAAGQTPTISFTVKDNAGTALRDLSGLNRLAFAMSGPTTDYTTLLLPTAVGGGASGMLVGPDAQGGFAYTPTTAIPSSATGTWALGAEARRSVELAEGIEVEEAAPNPVVTFTVDSSMAMPRRVVVEDQNCGVCHGEFSKGFSIHGNLRNRVEYCVICHNSTQSDVARRRRDPEAVAAGELDATIDFKVMIHKIHRGEELEQQPYIIYGFGLPPANFTKHNFGEVLFPGDLRICSACHVDNSQLIPPFPGTALPTLRTRLDPSTGNPVPADPPQTEPITAVCTSCHDSEDALAHAETNTAPDGGEACAVCHSEGRAFPVSRLHAGRR
jgi:OmcA/MtrC family decaheme c-type cytochrome